MTTPTPSGTELATLIDFLTRFYSTGQLQILLVAYEGEKPIPGRSDEEKLLRREALRTILNKHPVASVPDRPATKTKKRK